MQEQPETLFSKREQILNQAHEAITKQRNNTYGPPSQDFDRTAQMVTVLLGSKLKDEQYIEPHEIAMIQICVKLSRLTWSSDHDDSWTDIAGYAACGAEAVYEHTWTSNGRIQQR